MCACVLHTNLYSLFVGMHAIVRMHVCMYLHVHACTQMYMCNRVCVYIICVYAQTYVYVYVHMCRGVYKNM